MRELVKFKGNREGLIIILDFEADFQAILEELQARLDAAITFLAGAAVSVDLGSRDLEPGELCLLEKILLANNLRLRRVMMGTRSGKGVVSLVESSLQTAEKKEIGEVFEDENQDIPVIQYRLPAKNREDLVSQDQTVLIQRTVRSGQRIYYPGNVVVLGDVNPGAEIVAGGNIIVMGSFRGIAHAGALGYEKAVVAAIRLEPSQLRIAGQITRAPEGDFSITEEPEIARIQDGMVIIEKYQPGLERHLKGTNKGGR